MKKALRLSAIVSALFLAGCGGGGSSPGEPGFLPVPMPQPSQTVTPSTPVAPAPDQAPAKPASFDVTIFGDSIAAGSLVSVTPAQRLQSLRPNLTVVDRAAPSTTLVALATAWGQTPRDTRVIVIENGVIDAWLGMTANAFLPMVRSLVFGLRAEGRIPVLTGFSHQVVGQAVTAQMLDQRAKNNAGLKGLADELAVPFADWDTVEFNGASDLVDGVHPNQAYSDRLVERLATTLDGVQP